MASKLLKKTSSGTSPVVFYKKTSTGQVRCPVYRKTSTGMERLDQQLVTKTYTVTGYPDWLYTYIGDYTNKPIPSEYIEGLQSSFESNLVTQEMVEQGLESEENFL